MNSIPASQLVSSEPSVLSPGGNPLSLNMVMVDNSGDTSIPTGTVQEFADDLDVIDWYGPNSIQATLGGVYFGGFIGADSLPGALYFTQYNSAAVAAYLRGGVISAISLATLQSYSGSLVIAIDGRTVTSAAINLSSATSFSNAATLIQAGLQNTGNVFSGTGTVTNTSTTLTINTTVSGQLHVGDAVVGTDIPGGTTIASFGTYTVLAGTGTVVMSAAATGAAGPETVTVTAVPTVSYDSLRGAFVIESGTTGATSTIAYPTTASFATDLLLTSATGAVLSQGAAATTPAAAMNAVVNATQNWATFMTVVDPDAGAEPATVKLAFANWVSTQSPAGQERFAYAAFDSDLAPTTGTAPGSFGAQVKALGYNGVIPIFDLTAGQKAAFFGGMVASIDYTETQGAITFAGKGQAGLAVDVTSATVAQNLIANGYNFYGAYATANQRFMLFQTGSTPGQWVWADDYINQIWLNQAFQLALMTLLATVKKIPYNNAGYALLRAAMMDPINAAVNAGVIQPGVPLSASQAQQVNTAAGNNAAANVLSTLGWYLQILPAAAITRGNRASPPITFWYTDGGSVQTVNIASIDVQ